MLSPRFVCVATLLCIALCCAPVLAALPTHPDRVTSLPGLAVQPTFNHYSGHINVPGTPKMLHYWFVESAGNPATDPVVLWLNGGPGCSSMLGMLNENGPFRVQSDGATILPNAQSWNAFASVIYLESPSGVGFSYGTDNNYTSGDVSTAADNYAFLQAFFAEYSEFATNRFYVSGESFAGNYVPELVQLIIHSNAALAAASASSSAAAADGSIILNIQGFAVGNPTFGHGANAYLPFMASHGLIEARDMAQAREACNGTYDPPPTKECAAMVDALMQQVLDINPYDVTALCMGDGYGDTPGCFTLQELNDAHRPSGRMTAAGAAISTAAAPLFDLGAAYSAPPRMRTASVRRPSLGSLGQTFVPCIDLFPIRSYLNSPAVMDALHIDPAKVILPWDACSQVLNYDSWISDMVPIYEDILVNSTMRILVYSGDVDSCVPFPGTEAAVLSIPYAQRTPQLDSWRSWHYTSASVSSIKQVGGKFIQWGERLAFATVRGAGHMAPRDRPEATQSLFNAFLNDPTGRMHFE